MAERNLRIGDIIMIAGTRVILGMGLGLLLSGRLSRDTRKGAGVALFAVGALSTIPIFINVARNRPHVVERQAA